MTIKKKKSFDPSCMSHALSVSGRVNNPLLLSVDDLRRMEAAEVRNLHRPCRTGKMKGSVESYRGVLLRTILDRADIILKEHCSPNWIYVSLSSSEGYGAILFWHEIYNTPVGGQALVVFEKNGEPLDENEGEIAFLSASDYRPGPRRIRYLQRIEVHELTGNAE